MQIFALVPVFRFNLLGCNIIDCVILVGESTGFLQKVDMTIKNNGYSRLVCYNNWNRGNSVCDNAIRIERRKVESVILEAVKNKVLQPNLFEKLLKRIENKIKSGTEFNQILNNIFPERLKVQAIEYEDEVVFAIRGKAMPFRAYGRTAFPSMLSVPKGI